MSSFNLKSRMITNRDASPTVLTDPVFGIGRVEAVLGAERFPQTADAGSWVKCVSIPAQARLEDLHYFAGSLGTSAIDISCWIQTDTSIAQSSVVEGQIIGSSLFAQNIAGVDTGIALTDAMGTIAQQSIHRRMLPLWQNLGLPIDPGNIMIDLGFTVRTTNSVAGYVGLRARFVR